MGKELNAVVRISTLFEAYQVYIYIPPFTRRTGCGQVEMSVQAYMPSSKRQNPSAPASWPMLDWNDQVVKPDGVLKNLKTLEFPVSRLPTCLPLSVVSRPLVSKKKTAAIPVSWVPMAASPSKPT